MEDSGVLGRSGMGLEIDLGDEDIEGNKVGPIWVLAPGWRLSAWNMLAVIAGDAALLLRAAC